MPLIKLFHFYFFKVVQKTSIFIKFIKITQILTEFEYSKI